MFFRSLSHAFIVCALALLVSLCSAGSVRAQTDDFGDDAADPIQLFKRGQDAHARGDYEQAVSLYDAAIKVRPDFPEALFQRANALVSLRRYPEAEKSFQRTIELRADWALPRAALGALLQRTGRLAEADKYLEAALALEPTNSIALVALTELRLRNKAERSVLENLLQRLLRATAAEGATAALWVSRSEVERELGQRTEAMTSVNHALEVDSKNGAALMARAELQLAAGDFENAIRDAQAVRQLAPQSLNGTLFLAHVLANAGRAGEALKLLDALDDEKKRLPEVAEMRRQLTTSAAPETEDRAALEKLLEQQPRNAPLIARLCVLYRAEDTTRALSYCRRALEIEPTNADYATGYAAALVRAKRFEEAVSLLRRVVARVPDNYAAHANLATALYELKLYSEALVEYDWIIRTKPDMAVAYFFIATAHDQLGQYEQALAAYEKFLERADPGINQLEIDKVKLRLPSLRNQIRRGEGVKNKKGEE
jgi:tetratricopeptide (TPR) repeat protein